MSVKQCWLWGIIGGIIIAAIIMFAADALSHGEGECLTDAVGNVPLSNGGWVKVVDHLEGTDLDGYAHGHRNQYYGKNGKTTKQNTEFYGMEFGDFFANCPTAPPPTTPSTSTYAPSSNRPIVSSDYYRSPYRPAPVVEIEVQCTEQWLQEFLWQGETMLGLRLLPHGIETISDLWNAYGLSVDKGNKIKVFIGGWASYDDVTPFLQGLANLQLQPNMGFVIEQTRGTLINIEGCPVENSQKIWIQEGNNLIGFPEVPDLFELPSDFLSDKVVSVKVQVGTPWGAVYHTINEVGNEGDEPLRAGQAIVLTSTEFHSVNLSEPVAAAPSVKRRGTLAMAWGAMKR